MKFTPTEKYISDIEAEVKRLREAIKSIAHTAHAGGLDNLTEWEALNAIRKLSLPWWDKKTLKEEGEG